MSQSLTIVLADKTTRLPRTGLTVTLRYSVDSFASTFISGVENVLKPGEYEFNGTFVTAKYKTWVNGSEDTSWGGTNGRELVISDDLILKVTDGSGTYWEGRNLELRSIGDCTEAKAALNRDSGDDRYLMLDGSNDPELFLPKAGGSLDGDLLMTGNKISDLGAGTLPNDAVIVSQLDDAVTDLEAAITAIVVTPYQESPNVIRLMPGGVTETGKVYTTYAIAQNYCRGYADTNRRFVIDIEGAGSGGVSIVATNGAISGNAVFNNYVSLKGKNQNIILEVDDDVFSVTAGLVIIENLKIKRYDSGVGTPQFTNIIFKDVYFDFDVSVLTFSGCQFRGNCYVKNTGDVTIPNTNIGGPVISTGVLPATIQGWSEVPSTDF